MSPPWELLQGELGALEQVMFVRVTAALAIAVLVLSPDYGRFFPEHESVFLGGRSWTGRHITQLRATVVALCGLSMLGVASPLSSAALLVAFLALDRYTARFTPAIWHNLFHLHLFLLLSVVGEAVQHFAPARAEPVCTALRTLMIAQVGLVYLLAGVAKLRHGGLAWMWDARTLQLAIMLRGTRVGRALLRTRARRRVAAIGTVAFELGAPLLLLSPSRHPWFVLAAIGFHLAILATMRISFWHLWIFFPALLLS